ncbi:Helix-turn-helix domain of resolvase [compost metagenome]
MVEVLGCYSNRASWTIEKFDVIRDALDRIDAGKLRRPPAKNLRPAQRYRLTDRFTPDELNQLVARYQAGEMSTTLAKESSISKTAFLRLLAERGVRTRSRKLTAAQGEKILRLRRQGMVIREIAKQVDCSYDTARIFILTNDKQ